MSSKQSYFLSLAFPLPVKILRLFAGSLKNFARKKPTTVSIQSSAYLPVISFSPCRLYNDYYRLKLNRKFFDGFYRKIPLNSFQKCGFAR